MVVDIRVIRDKYSKRCKGFAYIEFADKATVEPSLELSGQMLLDQAVNVRSSEAERESLNNNPHHHQQRQQTDLSHQKTQAVTAAASQVANAINAAAGMNSVSGILANSQPMKLYVGSLHVNITSEDVRTIFDPFGEIDFVHLQVDAKSGRSQGYAFVQFKKKEDGEKAIVQLNGLEIAGQAIKVSVAQTKRNNDERNHKMGGAGGSGGLDDAIDDDGARGMKFSAQSRQALMAKLTGGSQAASIGQLGVAAMRTERENSNKNEQQRLAELNAPLDPSLEFAQGVLGPASPIPTPCVLLKNMFDPSEETESDWDKEIAEDVKQECESKFGAVSHIHVDRDSKGFAYLKFALEEAAVKAKKSLHGRWFAGRKIACDFQFLPVYNKHFNT
jgi:RNA-binding protein 39